jgi:alpha-ketoglutarate-dependent dioxygenase FTO
MAGKNKKSKKNKQGGGSDNDNAKPKSTETLASQLRRQRGTAGSTPLPPQWTNSQTLPEDKTFLTPDDGKLFEDCLKTSYANFKWQEPQDLEASLHTSYDQCFQQLEGLYLYDAVQPGGQRVSKTFVRRTLIGKPGSTYKYLGLRLFSHPWGGVDEDDEAPSGAADNLELMIALGYSKQHARALLQMGDLNQILVKKTTVELDKLRTPQKLLGSCDYSLTLVNRMDPSGEKKDLKRDAVLNQKTSVSWHKDSGLQDFSSIAVYHSLVGDETSHSKPWSVALKVAAAASASKKKGAPVVNNPTPALVVPLASGALYYLLDDFNHQHEHAVLSGARQLRYSSTHRVARGQTWQSIRDSCRTILGAVVESKDEAAVRGAKQLRAQQQLWTELEFEWIRQWYLQGKEHADLHAYWREPLQYMEDCWSKLLDLTNGVLQRLETGNKEAEDLYDVLIEAYQERIAMREKWETRLGDVLYTTLDPEAQPMPCHALDGALSLSQLQTTLSNVRKWKKRKFAGGSSKTKKEKRKVASNWDALKKTSTRSVPVPKKKKYKR